jgi:hypothetical protein
MSDSEFQFLDINMIYTYQEDGDTYPLISFEQSTQGMWLTLRSYEEFNHCIKEIITLAINCGFLWNKGDGEDELAQKLSNLWELNDDASIDDIFDGALEYLNDWAFNDDPGWALVFNRRGLLMESIWTDESDMWDESREERPPTLSFGSDVIRKMLKSGF